jgi:hypothetical protein
MSSRSIEIIPIESNDINEIRETRKKPYHPHMDDFPTHYPVKKLIYKDGRKDPVKKIIFKRYNGVEDNNNNNNNNNINNIDYFNNKNSENSKLKKKFLIWGPRAFGKRTNPSSKSKTSKRASKSNTSSKSKRANVANGANDWVLLNNPKTVPRATTTYPLINLSKHRPALLRRILGLEKTI